MESKERDLEGGKHWSGLWGCWAAGRRPVWQSLLRPSGPPPPLSFASRSAEHTVDKRSQMKWKISVGTRTENWISSIPTSLLISPLPPFIECLHLLSLAPILRLGQQASSVLSRKNTWQTNCEPITCIDWGFY